MSHTPESQPTDSVEMSSREAGGSKRAPGSCSSPLSQASGTPGGSRSRRRGSLSFYGCSFSSGGGTPEEGSQAERMLS